MSVLTYEGDASREAPRRHREIADVHFIAHRIMIYLLVATAVSVIGFPLFWMLISSFKPGSELYTMPPTFLPNEWTLQNYTRSLRANELSDLLHEQPDRGRRGDPVFAIDWRARRLQP